MRAKYIFESTNGLGAYAFVYALLEKSKMGIAVHMPPF